MTLPPKPWHPFERTGCGLRGGLCCFLFRSLIIVIPIVIFHDKQQSSLNANTSPWDDAWVRNNLWAIRVNYTARLHTNTSCYVCMGDGSRAVAEPIPFTWCECAAYYNLNTDNSTDGCMKQGNIYMCNVSSENTTFCPIACLHMMTFSGTKHVVNPSTCPHPLLSQISIQPEGWTKTAFRLNQAAQYECYYKPVGKVNVGNFTGPCGPTWTLLNDTHVSSDWGGNVSGAMQRGAMVGYPYAKPIWGNNRALTDTWWICGDEYMRQTLPTSWTGICTQVMLREEVAIIYLSSDHHQTVRGAFEHSKVYRDTTGVPREVPNEFRAQNQVAAGFESLLFWWETTNKNMDWISDIYYNQQRLAAFSDLGEQVRETSQTTLQTRIAADMMSAEKSGVCALFGDTCCTFIPHRTAPDGSFTKALTRLQKLSQELKDNAGEDM